MTRNTFDPWREVLANPALFALLAEIRRELQTCRTVLDVGCGDNSPMRFVQGIHSTGIDGHKPSLERAQARGTHDDYRLGDIRELAEFFQNQRFDACVALDVIEHLPKADGWRMLENMERLALKRVVIFTPNGFVPQQSKNGDLQEHLSGWLPEEMHARGYTVLGMHGPKNWRGEYARLKRRPRALWALVSVAAHYLYTKRRPHRAFSIFCQKHLTVA